METVDKEPGSTVSQLWSKILRGLGADSSSQASSSRVPPTISSVFKRRLPKRLNDDVYEIYRPETKPSVELVFFHGFELGDYQDAYWSDWLSADKTQCWLETWLVEDFPRARVLSVSYDSSLRQTSRFGRTDRYIVAENLVSSLIRGAKVGQNNCPVVLVGHSVGGLMMKELMVYVSHRSDSIGDPEEHFLPNFMCNVKGFFFFATPHNGSILAQRTRNSLQGPLLQDLELLDKKTARLNADFDRLLSKFKWKLDGVGEKDETLLGDLRVLVVEEASARHGMYRNFYTVSADHVNICKPDSRKSSSFHMLSTFIRRIVQQACVPIHQCEGLPEFLVELEEYAAEVQKKLKGALVQTPKGATTLGIFGMGGIGKTTLAKEVFNNISRDFEYTCFAENVKGVPEYNLQNWLLTHFHHNGRRSDGARTQWYDVKGKKTLIVMDDVNSENQLRGLPKLEDFGDGSHVIITTRDKNVMKFFFTCVPYEIRFLKEDMARKLFCQHAFGEEEIPHTYAKGRDQLQEDVDKVIKKCNGLPLTLEVIGRYLRGHEKDKRTWKETIEKLENAEAIDGSSEDRVWSKLEVSYNALAEKEKEMFVDAATCFLKRPVERALAAWSTTSGNSKTRWANLVSKCLVREVVFSYYDYSHYNDQTYTDENGQCRTIWMHEHLQDLGKRLASGNVIYAISNEDVNRTLELLNENEIKPETKAVFMGYNYPKSLGPDQKLFQMDLSSLGHLKELKYVDLGIHIIPHKSSSRSFQIASSRVSLLRLVGAEYSNPMSKFPVNLDDLHNLGVLEIENWRTTQEFAEALEKLSNLHILCLKRIEFTGNRLPEDFCRLSRMERLKLANMRLSKLPESFGSLSSLQHLSLDNINLSELPETFGNLSSLRTLKVIQCRELASLPNSFGMHLTSLEVLEIHSCPLLKRLPPQSLGQLTGVRTLSVAYCNALEELGDSFGSLSALETLELRHLDLWGALPANFGQLRGLRKLTIWHLDELQSLPDSFCLLASLQKLTIIAPKLKSLPENIGQVSPLRSLFIRCNIVEELPESLGELAALGELGLRLPCVKSMPESVGQLSGLRRLLIQDCARLESLPESIGRLQALKELDLGLGGVKSLPDSIGKLSSLQELNIRCDNLEKLPNSVGLLSGLKELSVRARKVKILPDSFGRLSSLTQLRLHARSVRALPERIGQLASLRQVLFNCDGHKRLPANFGILGALAEKIVLSDDQTTRLPEGLGDLSSLQHLALDGFPKLRSLTEELGNLSSLETLTLSFCSSLECLPESVGRLSHLRELTLLGCRKLKSLPANLGKPPSHLTALSQGENSNQTGRAPDESFLATTTTGGFKLVVNRCALLSDSVLESSGWMRVGPARWVGEEWCRRIGSIEEKIPVIESKPVTSERMFTLTRHAGLCCVLFFVLRVSSRRFRRPRPVPRPT